MNYNVFDCGIQSHHHISTGLFQLIYLTVFSPTELLLNSEIKVEI